MADKDTAKRNTARLFMWLGVAILLLLIANLLLYGRWKPTISLPAPPTIARPKLAIVIDDLGYAAHQADILYQIDPRITLAVLPHQRYSIQIAQKAKAQGQEVLLHLPLEPKRYEKYGKMLHMLLVDMKPDKLKRELKYSLDNIPLAVGINNHMGSYLTENEAQMRIVLGELKKRGLFFIDSRTTSDSIGYSLAKKMGLRAGKRDIFLDNVDRIEDITSQLNKLVVLAKQKGKAIGIGHPRLNTFSAIEHFLQSDMAADVQLAPVSELLD